MNFHVSALRGQDCRDFARVFKVDHPQTGAEAAFIADFYTICVGGKRKDKLAFIAASRKVADEIRRRLKWGEREWSAPASKAPRGKKRGGK